MSRLEAVCDLGTNMIGALSKEKVAAGDIIAIDKMPKDTMKLLACPGIETSLRYTLKMIIATSLASEKRKRAEVEDRNGIATPVLLF
mmetsp:Transcript_20468/g.33206  ORF Transcript_20468/g.33206 Transcript_20468/m.33206 type:complete len:87 (+) Transcript_20468:940-1200(+)